jgi:sulfatase-like protein
VTRVRTRSTLIALARALNATFFVLTSVYCLLTYSPFTYQQFVKPNVSVALAAFAVWHVSLYWLFLSITALTLAPFLEQPRVPAIGWSYLGASVALGTWLFMHPLWLQEGMSRTNLILAIIATLPPIWLAVFDVVSVPQVPLVMSNGTRVWTACWVTALCVWAAYAATAFVRLRLTGGIALPMTTMWTGWLVSALIHLTVFSLAFLALTVVAGIAAQTRSPGQAEYRLLWVASVIVIGLTLLRVVLAPIAIRGPAAWMVALSISFALASAWSGIARHRQAGRIDATSAAGEPESALTAWLGPIVSRRSPWRSAVGVVVAAAAAQLVIARVATFDWEFMLQKLTTLVFWLVAFAFIQAWVGNGRPRRALWVAPAIVIVLFAGGQLILPRVHALPQGARVSAEFALDGYAAVDPSFRIGRDTLGSGTKGDAAAFYTYLRANAGIQSEAIEPVSIDFVDAWSHRSARPPHLFVFIIDSLRRDYLAAYNGAVTFTPAFDAFAADSFVFRRAFSRYAGTGLAVPSIWAGAMLIHKQYVTPFAATNALEKLVAAKGYRRLITEDHITDELFTPSAGAIGLDHPIPEMFHTFCRTMGELGAHLEGDSSGAPLFVMTRPLDLHIGNVASATTPAGEAYPGFYGPYASRVRRIDACFGEFVATLKRAGLYDDSIIVVTSDHGDSLGEGQRWGHGFTAFPEVLRIPLMIHVPPARRSGLSADLTRLTFSTDITPTLYTLLGEPPSAERPRGARDLLMGASLFVDPSVDLSWRRRESYLIASSYGPVFGLLSQNGRRLYLADGVESREYAYDLHPDGTDTRTDIIDAEREANRREIRAQLADLAAWYRYTPAP